MTLMAYNISLAINTTHHFHRRKKAVNHNFVHENHHINIFVRIGTEYFCIC